MNEGCVRPDSWGSCGVADDDQARDLVSQTARGMLLSCLRARLEAGRLKPPENGRIVVSRPRLKVSLPAVAQ